MIYCFVEGPDDENLIKGILKNGNDETKFNFYPYAKKPKEKVKNYIKSVKAMGEQCLFFADGDGCASSEKMNDVKWRELKRLSRNPRRRREKERVFEEIMAKNLLNLI